MTLDQRLRRLERALLDVRPGLRPPLTPSRRKETPRSRRVGANRHRNHAESAYDDSAFGRLSTGSRAAGDWRRSWPGHLRAHGHLRDRLPDLGGTRPDRPTVHHELGPRSGRRPRRLRAWVRAGLLVAPVHGVLYAAQLADGLELRLACLRLVVPEDAVVTDRTAAWLHGRRWCSQPNAHLQVPRVDMFLPARRPASAAASSAAGSASSSRARSRRSRASASPRGCARSCDLGMKLPRKQAFAAMCAMLKVADFTS